MYLELKCRDIKYSKCKSFIIGKTKIDNINAKSSKTVYFNLEVWRLNLF
jgi:hypothetical protein